jgi:protein TonB
LTTPTAAHAPIAQATTAQPAEVTPAHRVATPPQTVAPDASAAAGQRAAAAGATSGAPSGSVENSASHSAPAALSLPRSDALGLNNPAPVYPRLSRRLNEQGQVVIRVWVSTQGLPEHAEVKSSSGFDRLDQEALRTVQRWRFVPGQRGGAVEAMWFNVPVHFVLNQ